MARIAGVDLPRDKRIVIGLTYIYGIGDTTAKKILAEAGVSEDVRVRDLTSDQEDKIRAVVDNYKVEGDLRREVSSTSSVFLKSAHTAAFAIVVICHLVDKTRRTMHVHAKVLR